MFTKVLTVILMIAIMQSPSAIVSDRDSAMMRVARSTRCLVCQNQSVADSDAAFAILVRDEIAHLLEQGLTEDAVLRELKHRYGEKIALNPNVELKTSVLWGAPFIVLLVPLLRRFVRNKP